MTGKTIGEPSAGMLKDVSNNVRFRYLGLGFLWAWIYATWLTPVVFPASTGLTVLNDPSWLWSCGTVALGLFLIPVLLKGRELLSIRWLRLSGSIGTSLGSVLMAMQPLFGIYNVAVASFGAILTGFASAVLWTAWGEFSGKVDIDLTETVIPCCVIIPVVVVFSTSFITGVVGALAVCLLPVVSGFLLELSIRDDEVLDPVPLIPEDERPHYIVDFIRMGIGSLAVYLCVAFIWGMTSYAGVMGWGATPVFPFIIGAMLAFVLTMLSVRFSRSIDLFGLYRWLIPLLLFSLVFMAVGQSWSSFLSYALMTAAQFGFDIIVWIYFTRIVRRGVCSGMEAIGINRGFVQAGVFTGSLCAAGAGRLIGAGTLSLAFVCLVVACVLVTVVLSVLTQREKLEHTIDPEKSAGGQGDEEKRIDLICEQLAKRYGLTDRERQILGYLAVGRSLPYIRDELVLSKNTVDTHAKNLYRKLGIHSRQELIDLFDEGSGR